MPMPIADDLRNLFQRFRRAGWITDFADCDGNFKLDYTPLGLRRIAALVEGFRDVRQSGFEYTSVAAGDVRECLAELLPPNLSQAEFMAFFGFIKSLQND